MTQQLEVKLIAITINNFSPLAYNPFYFFANTPFKEHLVNNVFAQRNYRPTTSQQQANNKPTTNQQQANNKPTTNQLQETTACNFIYRLLKNISSYF